MIRSHAHVGRNLGLRDSNAMNAAGISYFDMMDALAVHSVNEALFSLYEYMSIGLEMSIASWQMIRSCARCGEKSGATR